MDKSTVICLMGPTGSGKTELAIKLAKLFPLEIISVDSAMIYRGMNIGTAKPSPEILKKAPHHLIDIRDPNERYSAGDFVRDASALIKKIQLANKIPLLVGGTMLYFRSLQQPIAILPKISQEVRAKLNNECAEMGLAALYQRLQQVDPDIATRLHPHDTQRITRALEIYEQTGQPLSILQSQSKPKTNVQFLNIGLIPDDRAILHKKIEARFDQMLQDGLIDEVEALIAKWHLTCDLPAMRAVGYRQVWRYLAGEYDAKEMRLRAIVATRQLAKRQLTWLRSWPALHAFPAASLHAEQKIKNLIGSFNS